MAEQRISDQRLGFVEPGQLIGGYEILGRIGRGGMSEVYEALQTGTGRRTALKLLCRSKGKDRKFIDRLRREGYALAKIRHPNVVVVYDAGVSDGHAWIAMDRLEGQTLREFLLDHGRLPVPQALAYGAAICDGLDAAHQLGIIHRDMKPENVFVTCDGGLKIVDFGNAKLLEPGQNSTGPHQVIGTPAYMSPEQLRYRDRVGPRSDLYAVGLMLYEMLLGRHPFSRGADSYAMPSSLDLCRHQIETEPARLRDCDPRIPGAVSELVVRLAAKEPEQRPNSAFDCARELRDLRDRIVRQAHAAGLSPAGHVPSATSAPESSSTPRDPQQSGAHRHMRHQRTEPVNLDRVPLRGRRRKARRVRAAVLAGAATGGALVVLAFAVREVALREPSVLGEGTAAAAVAESSPHEREHPVSSESVPAPIQTAAASAVPSSEFTASPAPAPSNLPDVPAGTGPVTGKHSTAHAEEPTVSAPQRSTHGPAAAPSSSGTRSHAGQTVHARAAQATTASPPASGAGGSSSRASATPTAEAKPASDPYAPIF